MTQQNWVKHQHIKGGMSKVRVWGEEIQTIMCKVDKQKDIGQNKEINQLFCNNFKWSIIYKNIESLCCTPETNIVL